MNEIALNELPKPILDELETRQRNIVLAEMRSVLRKGEELQKAQALLAKHRYGCFNEWLDYIGIPRRTAYDYIERFSIVRDSHNKNLEDLSIAMLDAYRRKSTPPEIKEAIESGEVTTTKELKEMEHRLKEKEQEAAKYKEAVEILTDRNDSLMNERQPAPEPEIVEIVKEVVKIPEDYEKLKKEAEIHKSSYQRVYESNQRLQDENMSLRQQERDRKRDYNNLDPSAFYHYLRNFTVELKRYQAMKEDFQSLTPKDQKDILSRIDTLIDELTSLKFMITDQEVITIE